MLHLNASMQTLVKATVGICKLFEAETRLRQSPEEWNVSFKWNPQVL